jgi:hypothetical protein
MTSFLVLRYRRTKSLQVQAQWLISHFRATFHCIIVAEGGVKVGSRDAGQEE